MEENSLPLNEYSIAINNNEDCTTLQKSYIKHRFAEITFLTATAAACCYMLFTMSPTLLYIQKDNSCSLDYLSMLSKFISGASIAFPSIILNNYFKKKADEIEHNISNDYFERCFQNNKGKRYSDSCNKQTAYNNTYYFPDGVSTSTDNNFNVNSTVNVTTIKKPRGIPSILSKKLSSYNENNKDINSNANKYPTFLEH